MNMMNPLFNTTVWGRVGQEEIFDFANARLDPNEWPMYASEYLSSAG